MTTKVCKGTALETEIATVFTPVGQIISMDGPGPDVETYEADYLDQPNAGIPKKPTGRADGGSLNFQIFLDPALASHKDLLSLQAAPTVRNWKQIFSDAVEWAFAGTFKGLSPAVDLADGLKADCSIELDGLPTYPA